MGACVCFCGGLRQRVKATFVCFVSDESEMCQPSSEALPAKTSAANPSVPAAAHRYQHPDTHTHSLALRSALPLQTSGCHRSKVYWITVPVYWRHVNETWTEAGSFCFFCLIWVLAPHWHPLDGHSNRNWWSTSVSHFKHNACYIVHVNIIQTNLRETERLFAHWKWKIHINPLYILKGGNYTL